MKILVTGDWHLGLTTHGKIVDGVNSRELEIRDSIKHMVDYATEHVDTFIITGDIFHTNKPHPDSVHYFIRSVKELTINGINVLIISGNHDCQSNFVKVSPVNLGEFAYGREAYANVYYEEIGFYAVDQLGIVLVPYGKKLGHGNYLAKGYKTLLIGHTTLSGAVAGSESTMLSKYCETEPIPDWADITICGHIHKPQVVRKDPLAAYHGSIVQVNAGERNENKGFFVLDIDTQSQSTENDRIDFHRLPHRRIVQFDISHTTNIDAFTIALPRKDITDNIIKVTGTAQPGVNPDLIIDRINQFAPHNVISNIKRQGETIKREGQMDVEVSLAGAFEKYCDENNVHSDTKQLGLGLINGD